MVPHICIGKANDFHHHFPVFLPYLVFPVNLYGKSDFWFLCVFLSCHKEIIAQNEGKSVNVIIIHLITASLRQSFFPLFYIHPLCHNVKPTVCNQLSCRTLSRLLHVYMVIFNHILSYKIKRVFQFCHRLSPHNISHSIIFYLFYTASTVNKHLSTAHLHPHHIRNLPGHLTTHNQILYRIPALLSNNPNNSLSSADIHRHTSTATSGC